MLLTLHRAGYVRLEPEPPEKDEPPPAAAGGAEEGGPGDRVANGRRSRAGPAAGPGLPAGGRPSDARAGQVDRAAERQSALRRCFSSSNWASPIAPSGSRPWKACWSCRGSVGHFVRVPRQDQLPPGPLATTRLDAQLLQLGLATRGRTGHAAARRKRTAPGTPTTRIASGCWRWPTSCGGCSTTRWVASACCGRQPVWAAGELLEFGGDFNKYVTGKDLQKQEGVIFRHLLRLILLAGELKQLCPPGHGARPLAGRPRRHRRAAYGKLPPRGPDQHRQGAENRWRRRRRRGNKGGGRKGEGQATERRAAGFIPAVARRRKGPAVAAA